MQGTKMNIVTSDAYLIYKLITRARHSDAYPRVLQRGEYAHADALADKLWIFLMGVSPHAEAIAQNESWTQLRPEAEEGVDGH